MVCLDGAGLFNDALVSVGKGFGKEPLPFVIGKGVAVEKLQLLSEVGNQSLFVVDGKVLISLCGQQADEFFSRAASLWKESERVLSGTYSATTVLSLLAAMML